MDDYPIAVDVPVAWGDMDAFGHVNNTVYIRWFETARIALCEKLGLTVNRPEGIGPILASVTCNYVAPVEYPSTIVTQARVTNIGGRSLGVEHLVTLNGAAVARGTAVMVLFDYAIGESVAVPDDVRDVVASLEP